MRKTVSLLVAVAVLGWVATASAAVSLKLTSLAAGPSGTTLYLQNNGLPVETANLTQGGAVSFSDTSISYTGIDAGSEILGPLFCIEIPESITVGGYLPYKYGTATERGLVDLSEAPHNNGGYSPSPMELNATLIEGLWHNVMGNQTQIDAVVADVTKRGAFQLAVWKLEYDGATALNWTTGAVNWTSGSLTVRSSLNPYYSDLNDDAVLQAGAWIGELAAAGWDDTEGYLGGKAELVALTDPDQQDFVGQGTANRITTPEPIALAVWSVLGAAGAAGVAVRRRRGGRWSAENREAILGLIERKLQD